MHSGQAAISGEFFRGRVVPLGFWHPAREFGDHVAEPVDLLLPSDVADRSAGILDVLLPVHTCQIVSGSEPCGFQI